MRAGPTTEGALPEALPPFVGHDRPGRGGVGGAVVGSQVIGGGLLGTAAGAVGGALGGRAIDRIDHRQDSDYLIIRRRR